ncbi:MAG: ThiF family adenylyltransferase [Phycisphaerales bacterium]
MRDDDPLYRYHRQTLLEGFGIDGQRRLGEGHALVVGVGALGSPAADLLVRSGVGRVTLVDRDVVEVTNLQRQTLFDESDARGGRAKAEAARRRLGSINSQVRVEGVVADVSARTGEALILDGPLGRAGVVVDGTDNFETRFLLNDVSVKHGIPYVYAGAVGTRAMSATFRPPETACLRCLFDAPIAGTGETCDSVGVLAPVAAMVGAYQAVEAIKILLGRTDLSNPSLLSFDPWLGRRTRIDLSDAKRADCPCCGERRFEFLAGARGGRTTSMCGQGAVQVSPGDDIGEVDLGAVLKRLSIHGAFALEEGVVRGALSAESGDDGGPVRLTVFQDGRAIVHGTTEAARARGVYAKYVGG